MCTDLPSRNNGFLHSSEDDVTWQFAPKALRVLAAKPRAQAHDHFRISDSCLHCGIVRSLCSDLQIQNPELAQASRFHFARR
jgi:hypothetical protein